MQTPAWAGLAWPLTPAWPLAPSLPLELQSRASPRKLLSGFYFLVLRHQ